MTYLNRNRRWTFMTLLALPLLLLAAACSTEPDEGVGTMEVRMHDAPADFDEVNVFVERVELNRTESEGEGWFVFSEPQQTFNLLELVNGTYEVLGEGELETGTYRQIRLILSQEGTNLVRDGEEIELFVPSGEQTGLKINVDAEIQSGIRYVLNLDFDADRSLVKRGQSGMGYNLKPVIRAYTEADAGAIAGSVTPEARAAIYAYLNDGTDDAEPVTTSFADEINGEFMILGLPDDTYTVSIEPRNEDYLPTEIEDVEVVTGQVTEVGEIELEFIGEENGDDNGDEENGDNDE